MKMGGSTSANVQKTTQNSNNNSNIDATSQQRTGSIWDAANGAADAGPAPEVQNAANAFTGYQNGGQLGFAAMTGDPTAQSQFMNPYQSQVMDANNAQWQKINAQTVNQQNDLATKAGAFGGSRHGVAEGVALGNNAAAQGAQNANLEQSGFNDTMNRAGQAAQLGFNAAGANAQLGASGALSPAAYRLQMLKAGYMGPQGTTSQTSGAQTTFGGQAEAHGGIGF